MASRHWSDGNGSKDQQRTGREHHFHQHWSSAGSPALEEETQTLKSNIVRDVPTKWKIPLFSTLSKRIRRYPLPCLAARLGFAHSAVLIYLQSLSYLKVLTRWIPRALPDGMRVTRLVISHSLVLRLPRKEFLEDADREKRWRRASAYLLYDNARPHVAKEAREELRELDWDTPPETSQVLYASLRYRVVRFPRSEDPPAQVKRGGCSP